MGSLRLHSPLPILLFFLLVSLFSLTHSADCSSLKLPGGKMEYSNCIELPTLKSTLHFTYDSANSSLSVAFSAAPPSPDGWVAWAINPTDTGMKGSQALIAFKSKGSIAVQTYNVTSQGVAPAKLSFEVWDLAAEAGNDGKTVIYGSLKVPASSTAGKLNQVWQVGPVSSGEPGMHKFSDENLGSTAELKLVEKTGSNALSPADGPTAAIQTETPTATAAATPEAASNSQSGSSDGWRVREMNAGFWMLGLVSMLLQRF